MTTEMKTAVPVGAGNGGNAGKLGSPSEDYNYSSETLAASSPVLFRPAASEVAV